MQNILKFDLYKVLHSIWFKVLIIITVSLFFLSFINKNGNDSILSNFTQILNGKEIIIILFAIFFGSMDYTNGFEKNITDSNKYLSILSKILVIIFFTLFVFIIAFFVAIIYSLIFDCGVFYNPYIDSQNGISMFDRVNSDAWSLGNFFAFVSIKWLLFSAVGIGVFIFTLIVRSRIVSAIITLLYWFLCTNLFSLINSIFGNSINVGDYSLIRQTNSFYLSFQFSQEFAHFLYLGIIYFFIYTALCFVVATFQKSFYGKKLFRLKRN